MEPGAKYKMDPAFLSRGMREEEGMIVEKCLDPGLRRDDRKEERIGAKVVRLLLRQ